MSLVNGWSSVPGRLGFDRMMGRPGREACVYSPERGGWCTSFAKTTFKAGYQSVYIGA